MLLLEHGCSKSPTFGVACLLFSYTKHGGEWGLGVSLLGRIYSVEVSHCDHSKKYFHKLLLYAKMVVTSPTFMLLPCENDNETPHKICSSCFSWYSRLCYPPHTYSLELYCYIFRCCGLPKFWIIFDMLGVHPNNFFLLHVQPLKVWMFTYNRIDEASPCMWD